MSVLTRLRQTAYVVAAWVQPIDESPARQQLNDAEFGLFQRLRPPEKAHHLRVHRDLVNDGYTDTSLLKAALLHDVGKTRYSFRLPSKVIVVLVKKLAPILFYKWAEGDPDTWRRPFIVSAKHPQWSAEMGDAIGMDETSIELMRQHQDTILGEPKTAFDALLLALQAADDRN